MSNRSVFSISMIVFVIVLFGHSFNLFAGDFRETTWGMSKSEVKKTEHGKPVEEDQNAIAYKNSIAELDAVVIYRFINNKLYSSGYLIEKKYVNANNHIDDFIKLDNLLTKKYGKPKSSKQIWKDDLYKKDKKDWGLAISAGQMLYITSWETDTTEILHILAGESFKINHAITYQSKKLKKAGEEEKEKEHLKGL